MRFRRYRQPQSEPYTYRYDGSPWPPEPPLEPWREHWDAHRVILLSVDAALQLANPSRMHEISRQREYLDDLKRQVVERGIERPLIIDVDSQCGKAVFRDGHHRLTVARELGLAHVPVVVERTEWMRGFGRPVNEVLELLLLGVQT